MYCDFLIQCSTLGFNLTKKVVKTNYRQEYDTKLQI